VPRRRPMNDTKMVELSECAEVKIENGARSVNSESRSPERVKSTVWRVCVWEGKATGRSRRRRIEVGMRMLSDPRACDSRVNVQNLLISQMMCIGPAFQITVWQTEDEDCDRFMGDTTFLPLRYNKRIVFNWGGIAGSTGICLNRSSTSTSAVFTCVWVLVTVLSTQSGGSNGVLCTAGANCHFKPGPQNPTHSAGPLLSEISLYQPTNQPPLANQRITRVTVSGSEWGDIRIPFFWCSNLVSATSSAVNQCAIRKDSKGLSEQEIGDLLVHKD
jgi:hypothetical protein